MTSGEERQEVERLWGLPVYEELPEAAARMLAERRAAAARGDIQLCGFEAWAACDELAVYEVRAPGREPALACREHVEEVIAAAVDGGELPITVALVVLRP